MDFGLGLVLSFTDNASAGIQSAISSLNQLTSQAENANNSLNQIVSLSAFSGIANQVGSSMMNAGSAIISTFSGAISKITETGQTLAYAETAFDTLYKEQGKGKEVLAQIQQYAEKSIFAFEDMIPVVRMLKANGIDAFETITSSSGQSSQLLMDYASDLAAFNPQMRNAYGTGIQAAMGALNEYIAEGNKRLLKSGASLDITQLLGEEKGATIEERSRQVADLLEQLGMVGMTANMAGTPMQQLSNMGDVLFNTLGKISNAGVYEEFTKIISIFADFVFGLEESGKLDKVAESLGSALTSLMSPLEKVAGLVAKLGNAIVDLVANNPFIAKLVLIGTALAGAFLLVGGVVLKIASMFAGLNVMMLTMGTTFGAVKLTMINGIKAMLGHLAPLAISIGLLYLAWKNDFAGMRTNLTWFVGEVQNSFSKAKSAVNGSVGDLIATMGTLNVGSNFFDGLTLAIMRVQVLWKALCEGWNNFTLSEDTYLKAKELGILPLIEAIFDLKYRFDAFKQGFIEGWTDISNWVIQAFSVIKTAISGTIFDTILQKITAFVQMLSNNDAESWRTVGKVFAYITAQVVAGYIAFRTFKKVVSIVSGVIKVVKTLGTAIITAFKFLINNPIVMVIAGIITMIGALVDMWNNGVNKINAGIFAIGAVITAVGLGLLTSNPIVALIALIVAGVVSLVMVIKTHWTEIKAFLSSVWESIKTIAMNVWNAIKSFFSTIWEGIKTVFFTVVNAIKTFLSTAWNTIKTVASTVWNAIKTFFSTIWNGIKTVFTTAINAISTSISTAWNSIKTVTSTIWNAIKSTTSSVCSAVSSAVGTAWTSVKTKISTAVNGAKTVVSTAFNGIKSTVSSVGSAIASAAGTAFNSVKTKISTAISGAKTVVSNGLSSIKGFFSRLSLKLPHIALPHFSISGSLSISPPSVPHLSVSWYEKGAIFDKPSLIGVGENGKEAVMPLEKNTGWINNLAGQLVDNVSEMIPSNSNGAIASNTSGGNTYMTNNSGGNTTDNSTTDNSVVFENGAIQIIANNSSVEEAEKLAEQIMAYIQRKQQIKSMLSYA